MSKLQQGILKIQTDLKLFAKKSARNTMGKGYDYYTESDIYEALKPKLAEQGINYVFSLQGETSISPVGNMWLFSSAATLTLICGEEREVINCHFVATNTDPAKAQGSAMTYGIKYWLCKVFGIATNELDPDRTENSALDIKKGTKTKPLQITTNNHSNIYQQAKERAKKDKRFMTEIIAYCQNKGLSGIGDINEAELKILMEVK